ncbi:ABC transporter permease subunit [Schaalia sp. ZJ1691]|uniref:ABC transporter permease n=1 Tax=Schaalia sp. ZJ1691 TaxID=2709404 RepID=UPI0013ED69C6|nr:ABC transporter permease subunit [Schaalia sp. ZJ1691]
MNLLVDAWGWLIDPQHWVGDSSIPLRLAEHIAVSFAAIVIASVVAIPLGILIGHTKRGGSVIGAMTGAARALPTLGLLTLVGLWLGIGVGAPLVALVVLAIPSVLAGAYSGVESVDRSTVQAAQAMGFTPLQVVARVEIPLASPLIIGGLRNATVQVIATTTLAAYTANLGLGRYLFAGLKTRDYSQMLAGSLLVTALAIIAEIVFSQLQRLGERRAHPRTPTKDPSRGHSIDEDASAITDHMQADAQPPRAGTPTPA